MNIYTHRKQNKFNLLILEYLYFLFYL